MSEDERTPNPDFSFGDIPIGDVEIPLEFPSDPHIADIVASTPNPKANKKRWWQSKEKTEKPTRNKPRKPMPAMPTGGLKQPITDLYIGLGLGLMPFNVTLAKSVIESAEPCADAWVEYAKTNPAVKRFLINLCSTTAAGKVFMAHMPILLAVVVSTPAFQKKQGAQIAEMAERFANMNFQQKEDDES